MIRTGIFLFALWLAPAAFGQGPVVPADERHDDGQGDMIVQAPEWGKLSSEKPSPFVIIKAERQAPESVDPALATWVLSHSRLLFRDLVANLEDNTQPTGGYGPRPGPEKANFQKLGLHHYLTYKRLNNPAYAGKGPKAIQDAILADLDDSSSAASKAIADEVLLHAALDIWEQYQQAAEVLVKKHGAPAEAHMPVDVVLMLDWIESFLEAKTGTKPNAGEMVHLMAHIRGVLAKPGNEAVQPPAAVDTILKKAQGGAKTPLTGQEKVALKTWLTQNANKGTPEFKKALVALAAALEVAPLMQTPDKEKRLDYLVRTRQGPPLFDVGGFPDSRDLLLDTSKLKLDTIADGAHDRKPATRVKVETPAVEATRTETAALTEAPTWRNIPAGQTAPFLMAPQGATLQQAEWVAKHARQQAIELLKLLSGASVTGRQIKEFHLDTYINRHRPFGRLGGDEVFTVGENESISGPALENLRREVLHYLTWDLEGVLASVDKALAALPGAPKPSLPLDLNAFFDLMVVNRPNRTSPPPLLTALARYATTAMGQLDADEKKVVQAALDGGLNYFELPAIKRHLEKGLPLIRGTLGSDREKAEVDFLLALLGQVKPGNNNLHIVPSGNNGPQVRDYLGIYGGDRGKLPPKPEGFQLAVLPHDHGNREIFPAQEVSSQIAEEQRKDSDPRLPRYPRDVSEHDAYLARAVQLWGNVKEDLKFIQSLLTREPPLKPRQIRAALLSRPFGQRLRNHFGWREWEEKILAGTDLEAVLDDIGSAVTEGFFSDLRIGLNAIIDQKAYATTQGSYLARKDKAQADVVAKLPLDLLLMLGKTHTNPSVGDVSVGLYDHFNRALVTYLDREGLTESLLESVPQSAVERGDTARTISNALKTADGRRALTRFLTRAVPLKVEGADKAVPLRLLLELVGDHERGDNEPRRDDLRLSRGARLFSKARPVTRYFPEELVKKPLELPEPELAVSPADRLQLVRERAGCPESRPLGVTALDRRMANPLAGVTITAADTKGRVKELHGAALKAYEGLLKIQSMQDGRGKDALEQAIGESYRTLAQSVIDKDMGNDQLLHSPDALLLYDRVSPGGKNLFLRKVEFLLSRGRSASTERAALREALRPVFDRAFAGGTGVLESTVERRIAEKAIALRTACAAEGADCDPDAAETMTLLVSLARSHSLPPSSPALRGKPQVLDIAGQDHRDYLACYARLQEGAEGPALVALPEGTPKAGSVIPDLIAANRDRLLRLLDILDPAKDNEAEVKRAVGALYDQHKKGDLRATKEALRNALFAQYLTTFEQAEKLLGEDKVVLAPDAVLLADVAAGGDGIPRLAAHLKHYLGPEKPQDQALRQALAKLETGWKNLPPHEKDALRAQVRAEALARIPSAPTDQLKQSLALASEVLSHGDAPRDLALNGEVRPYLARDKAVAHVTRPHEDRRVASVPAKEFKFVEIRGTEDETEMARILDTNQRLFASAVADMNARTCAQVLGEYADYLKARARIVAAAEKKNVNRVLRDRSLRPEDCSDEKLTGAQKIALEKLMLDDLAAIYTKVPKAKAKAVASKVTADTAILFAKVDGDRHGELLRARTLEILEKKGLCSTPVTGDGGRFQDALCRMLRDPKGPAISEEELDSVPTEYRASTRAYFASMLGHNATTLIEEVLDQVRNPQSPHHNEELAKMLAADYFLLRPENRGNTLADSSIHDGETALAALDRHREVSSRGYDLQNARTEVMDHFRRAQEPWYCPDLKPVPTPGTTPEKKQWTARHEEALVRIYATKRERRQDGRKPSADEMTPADFLDMLLRRKGDCVSVAVFELLEEATAATDLSFIQSFGRIFFGRYPSERSSADMSPEDQMAFRLRALWAVNFLQTMPFTVQELEQIFGEYYKERTKESLTDYFRRNKFFDLPGFDMDVEKMKHLYPSYQAKLPLTLLLYADALGLDRYLNSPGGQDLLSLLVQQQGGGDPAVNAENQRQKMLQAFAGLVESAHEFHGQDLLDSGRLTDGVSRILTGMTGNAVPLRDVEAASKHIRMAHALRGVKAPSPELRDLAALGAYVDAGRLADLRAAHGVPFGKPLAKLDAATLRALRDDARAELANLPVGELDDLLEPLFDALEASEKLSPEELGRLRERLDLLIKDNPTRAGHTIQAWLALAPILVKMDAAGRQAFQVGLVGAGNNPDLLTAFIGQMTSKYSLTPEQQRDIRAAAIHLFYGLDPNKPAPDKPSPLETVVADLVDSAELISRLPAARLSENVAALEAAAGKAFDKSLAQKLKEYEVVAAFAERAPRNEEEWKEATEKVFPTTFTAPEDAPWYERLWAKAKTLWHTYVSPPKKDEQSMRAAVEYLRLARMFGTTDPKAENNPAAADPAARHYAKYLKMWEDYLNHQERNHWVGTGLPRAYSLLARAANQRVLPLVRDIRGSWPSTEDKPSTTVDPTGLTRDITVRVLPDREGRSYDPKLSWVTVSDLDRYVQDVLNAETPARLDQLLGAHVNFDVDKDKDLTLRARMKVKVYLPGCQGAESVLKEYPAELETRDYKNMFPGANVRWNPETKTYTYLGETAYTLGSRSTPWVQGREYYGAAVTGECPPGSGKFKTVIMPILKPLATETDTEGGLFASGYRRQLIEFKPYDDEKALRQTQQKQIELLRAYLLAELSKIQQKKPSRFLNYDSRTTRLGRMDSVVQARKVTALALTNLIKQLDSKALSVANRPGLNLGEFQQKIAGTPPDQYLALLEKELQSPNNIMRWLTLQSKDYSHEDFRGQKDVEDTMKMVQDYKARWRKEMDPYQRSIASYDDVQRSGTTDAHLELEAYLQGHFLWMWMDHGGMPPHLQQQLRNLPAPVVRLMLAYFKEAMRFHSVNGGISEETGDHWRKKVLKVLFSPHASEILYTIATDNNEGMNGAKLFQDRIVKAAFPDPNEQFEVEIPGLLGTTKFTGKDVLDFFANHPAYGTGWDGKKGAIDLEILRDKLASLLLTGKLRGGRQDALGILLAFNDDFNNTNFWSKKYTEMYEKTMGGNDRYTGDVQKQLITRERELLAEHGCGPEGPTRRGKPECYLYTQFVGGWAERDGGNTKIPNEGYFLRANRGIPVVSRIMYLSPSLEDHHKRLLLALKDIAPHTEPDDRLEAEGRVIDEVRTDLEAAFLFPSPKNITEAGYARYPLRTDYVETDVQISDLTERVLAAYVKKAQSGIVQTDYYHQSTDGGPSGWARVLEKCPTDISSDPLKGYISDLGWDPGNAEDAAVIGTQGGENASLMDLLAEKRALKRALDAATGEGQPTLDFNRVEAKIREYLPEEREKIQKEIRLRAAARLLSTQASPELLASVGLDDVDVQAADPERAQAWLAKIGKIDAKTPLGCQLRALLYPVYRHELMSKDTEGYSLWKEAEAAVTAKAEQEGTELPRPGTAEHDALVKAELDRMLAADDGRAKLNELLERIYGQRMGGHSGTAAPVDWKQITLDTDGDHKPDERLPAWDHSGPELKRAMWDEAVRKHMMSCVRLMDNEHLTSGRQGGAERITSSQPYYIARCKEIRERLRVPYRGNAGGDEPCRLPDNIPEDVLNDPAMLNLATELDFIAKAVAAKNPVLGAGLPGSEVKPSETTLDLARTSRTSLAQIRDVMSDLENRRIQLQRKAFEWGARHVAEYEASLEALSKQMDEFLKEGFSDEKRKLYKDLLSKMERGRDGKYYTTTWSEERGTEYISLREFFDSETRWPNVSGPSVAQRNQLESIITNYQTLTDALATLKGRMWMDRFALEGLTGTSLDGNPDPYKEVRAAEEAVSRYLDQRIFAEASRLRQIGQTDIKEAIGPEFFHKLLKGEEGETLQKLMAAYLKKADHFKTKYEPEWRKEAKGTGKPLPGFDKNQAANEAARNALARLVGDKWQNYLNGRLEAVGNEQAKYADLDVAAGMHRRQAGFYDGAKFCAQYFESMGFVPKGAFTEEGELRSEDRLVLQEALQRYSMAQDRMNAFMRAVLPPASADVDMEQTLLANDDRTKAATDFVKRMCHAATEPMFTQLVRDFAAFGFVLTLPDGRPLDPTNPNQKFTCDDLLASSTKSDHFITVFEQAYLKAVRERATVSQDPAWKQLRHLGFTWDGTTLGMDNLKLHRMFSDRAWGEYDTNGNLTAERLRCGSRNGRGNAPECLDKLKAALQAMAKYGGYARQGVDPWEQFLERLRLDHRKSMFGDRFTFGDTVVQILPGEKPGEKNFLNDPANAQKYVVLIDPAVAKREAQQLADDYARAAKAFQDHRNNAVAISNRFIPIGVEGDVKAEQDHLLKLIDRFFDLADQLDDHGNLTVKYKPDPSVKDEDAQEIPAADLADILRVQTEYRNKPDALTHLDLEVRNNLKAMRDFWTEVIVTEAIMTGLTIVTAGGAAPLQAARWIRLAAQVRSGIRLAQYSTIASKAIFDLYANATATDGLEHNQPWDATLDGLHRSRIMFGALPLVNTGLGWLGTASRYLRFLQNPAISHPLGLGGSSFLLDWLVYHNDPMKAMIHGLETAPFALPWNQWMGRAFSRVPGLRFNPALQRVAAGVGTYGIFAGWGAALAYLDYLRHGKYIDPFTGKEVENPSFGLILKNSAISGLALDLWFGLQAGREVQLHTLRNVITRRGFSEPQVIRAMVGDPPREPAALKEYNRKVAEAKGEIAEALQHIPYGEVLDLAEQAERLRTDPDPKRRGPERELILRTLDTIAKYQGFHGAGGSGEVGADGRAYVAQLRATSDPAVSRYKTLAEVGGLARQRARHDLLERYNRGELGLRELLDHPLFRDRIAEEAAAAEGKEHKPGEVPGLSPEALSLLPAVDILNALENRPAPRQWRKLVHDLAELLKSPEIPEGRRRGLRDLIAELRRQAGNPQGRKNVLEELQTLLKNMADAKEVPEPKLAELKSAADKLETASNEAARQDLFGTRLQNILKATLRNYQLERNSGTGTEDWYMNAFQAVWDRATGAKQTRAEKFEKAFQDLLAFMRNYRPAQGETLAQVIAAFSERTPLRVRGLVINGQMDMEDLERHFGKDVVDRSFADISVAEAQVVAQLAEQAPSQAVRTQYARIRDRLAENAGLSKEAYSFVAPQLLSDPASKMRTEEGTVRWKAGTVLADIARTGTPEQKAAAAKLMTDSPYFATVLGSRWVPLKALDLADPADRAGHQAYVRKVAGNYFDLAAQELGLKGTDRATFVDGFTTWALGPGRNYDNVRDAMRDYARSVARKNGTYAQDPFFKTPLGAYWVPTTEVKLDVEAHQTYAKDTAGRFYDALGLDLGVTGVTRDKFRTDFVDFLRAEGANHPNIREALNAYADKVRKETRRTGT